MNIGFYTILMAQFLSALADNTLLFAAIALLKILSAPPEYVPILQQFFVVSYIVLAPFVGAFSDALPKGQVMFISNLIKLFGCVAMLFGVNPLYSYALVGLGAAAYSPAKYGILTEYLSSDLLVVANSWMEGLTVLAIILGAVLGGVILNEHFWAYQSLNHLLHSLSFPEINSPQFSILIVLVLYVLAALFNLKIPKVKLDHKLKHNNPFFIIMDFARSFKMLWQDPLGKVSLAVTTLFWGVGSTLRLIVLVWASLQLHFSLERATQITAVSAIGIALGAIAAAKFVKLENSLKVLPVGIAMGLAIFGMLFIHDWHKAIVLLILAGAMGGFFVVPMNALLQHRGHQLMGAGHSIAVQNFNENISILLMMGVYAIVIRADQPLSQLYRLMGVEYFKAALLIPSESAFYTSVILLALFISGVMYWLYRRYRHVEYID
ncbi:MAG: lysophospholipid transporter LplT [Betaproteobacteria bacterium]|nr:lysophospholipid transporter LplT [Betaproteobacteria bacterium]MDE2424096.1 lysophospholipid transporter LplT [Betaproteobacteria bacterium]